MELTKPKAVLYDWDNTLVDTWPVIHEAMVYCFEKMGHTPWTLEEVKARVARSMRDEFPLLFGDRWEEAGQHYQEGYRRIHCDRLQAYEGAEAVLKQAQLAGVYQAIVSNKKGPTLRKEADHLGWTPYFTALIGSGDAANDKPHTDHSTKALLPFGIHNPAEVWFIGDSEVDMELAAAAGFTPIFYGTTEKAATVAHPIAARVENHAELAQLLKKHL